MRIKQIAIGQASVALSCCVSVIVVVVNHVSLLSKAIPTPVLLPVT